MQRIILNSYNVVTDIYNISYISNDRKVPLKINILGHDLRNKIAQVEKGTLGNRELGSELYGAISEIIYLGGMSYLVKEHEKQNPL